MLHNMTLLQKSPEENQMAQYVYFLGSTMKDICFVDIKTL